MSPANHKPVGARHCLARKEIRVGSEIVAQNKNLHQAKHNEHSDNEKVMVLWCHNEINGTIGTYPYRKVSDEIQRILQDYGIADVKVYRLERAKVSTAGNRRQLPNGNVVWLDKEAPAPLKPTDTLFSLIYPYDWGETPFKEICNYFASIPNMNGRWEVNVVDKEVQRNWSISANKETFEFLSKHWGIIPDSDPMFLSECTAEQVKAWLFDAHEWKQRDQLTQKKTYHQTRMKWLYLEKGKVIQHFYEKSELAHYIYTSDTAQDGLVKAVVEDDLVNKERSTAVNEPAQEFLDRYERFHPLFPPRDKEVPERLRETRYVLEGEMCTAKDLWERSYRSQIDNLIRSGTENHIAALVLMMPCMDMVYKLKTGNKKSCWTEVMKLFFPAFGFSETTYHQLRGLVRNGFVHDGFTTGFVGISSTHHTPEEYTDSQQVFQGMRSETGQFHLLIIPAFFWARVRNLIDTFYKYEQWIPGWDMSQVVSINHYVEPLTKEELTQTE